MPVHIPSPTGTRLFSFHMGPRPLVSGGDNLEKGIIDFIDGANHKLDIAVQELESLPIARAILRAKLERKVSVRIVIESDYLRASKKHEDPWVPVPLEEKVRGTEPNREVFAAMNRAKIAIRNDYNSSIFHQKFIVRDKGKATSGVLTGSTNFTPTGVKKNLNHVIVVHDDGVAREYDAEFREIWGGGFGRRSIRPGDKPKYLRVGGVRVKPLFAPEHAPEMEVMKQVLKAEERIDFAMFTFSQTSGIDDTLRTMARDTTVPITGLLDRAQANQDWAPTDDLSLYDTVSLNLTRKGIREEDEEARKVQGRVGRFVRRAIDGLVQDFGVAVE